MNRGFTLAELLIALAILGVIATFMIPKVLQSQQDGKYKAIAKEAAATISEGYTLYKRSNTPTAATKPSIIMPYLNYVKRDTVSLVDDAPNGTTIDCGSSSTHICLTLHNGAILMLNDNFSFGGTTDNRIIWFLVDPDGLQNANRKSLWLALYFNGRISSYANLAAGTQDDSYSYSPDPSLDPSWFSWD